jgi:ribosomal subunit interface protein
MNIRVKATNYEMTEETSRYLDSRLDALQRLLGSDESQSRCEVELGIDAGGQRHGANMYFAEFHIIYPGGSVRATNRSESINGAIDDAKEETARQLRRERKLHIRMWRKSGAAWKRLLRSE